MFKRDLDLGGDVLGGEIGPSFYDLWDVTNVLIGLYSWKSGQFIPLAFGLVRAPIMPYNNKNGRFTPREGLTSDQEFVALRNEISLQLS